MVEWLKLPKRKTLGSNPDPAIVEYPWERHLPQFPTGQPSVS